MHSFLFRVWDFPLPSRNPIKFNVIKFILVAQCKQIQTVMALIMQSVIIMHDVQVQCSWKLKFSASEEVKPSRESGLLLYSER